MDSENIPPVIMGAGGRETRPAAKWRWWIHLLLLAAFPLVVGGLSYQRSLVEHTPALPTTIDGLLLVCLEELLFFGVLFGAAWLASRAGARDLMLKWRGGFRPVAWGVVYSIALRIGVMVAAAIAALIWFVASGGHLNDLRQSGPKTEELVNADALVGHPLYLALMLTLVSFVVAGLREELWRSGMLAGMKALFPRLLETWTGKFAAVFVTALIFGLGHVIQGWTGVAVTALLGIGLGLIMLWHQSIWEAVLAHGFFDASSFLALYFVAKDAPDLLHRL